MVSRMRSNEPLSEPHHKYNTADERQLSRKIDAPGSSLSQRTVVQGMCCGRLPHCLVWLDSGTPRFVVRGPCGKPPPLFVSPDTWVSFRTKSLEPAIKSGRSQRSVYLVSIPL